jgi:TRAP-type C4-dicarboxylate transport system permease small subunit
MLRPFLPSRPLELTKWCVYALVLLAPGSFVVLGVLWFVRLLRGPSPACGAPMVYSRKVPVVTTKENFACPNT